MESIIFFLVFDHKFFIYKYESKGNSGEFEVLPNEISIFPQNNVDVKL